MTVVVNLVLWTLLVIFWAFVLVFLKFWPASIMILLFAGFCLFLATMLNSYLAWNMYRYPEVREFRRPASANGSYPG